MHAMHALHATTATTATTTRLPMTPNDTPSSGPIAASPSCTPLTADIFARMVSAPTWTNKISPPDLALARLSRLAQHHPPHRPTAVRQNDPDVPPIGFFNPHPCDRQTSSPTTKGTDGRPISFGRLCTPRTFSSSILSSSQQKFFLIFCASAPNTVAPRQHLVTHDSAAFLAVA